MISYELAKKLKDAGFPQKEGDETVGRFMDMSGAYTKYGTRNPTLSELIEVVSMFTMGRFSLEQHSNDWRAGIYVEPKQFASGSTPEEAVANLYILLYGKVETK